MLMEEVIKALDNGKTLTNEQGIRMFKDTNDNAYVVQGSGFVSRAATYEYSDKAGEFIHFFRVIDMMGKDVPIPKFTINASDWRVME